MVGCSDFVNRIHPSQFLQSKIFYYGILNYCAALVWVGEQYELVCKPGPRNEGRGPQTTSSSDVRCA